MRSAEFFDLVSDDLHRLIHPQTRREQSKVKAPVPSPSSSLSLLSSVRVFRRLHCCLCRRPFDFFVVFVAVDVFVVVFVVSMNRYVSVFFGWNSVFPDSMEFMPRHKILQTLFGACRILAFYAGKEGFMQA